MVVWCVGRLGRCTLSSPDPPNGWLRPGGRRPRTGATYRSPGPGLGLPVSPMTAAVGRGSSGRRCPTVWGGQWNRARGDLRSGAYVFERGNLTTARPSVDCRVLAGLRPATTVSLRPPTAQFHAPSQPDHSCWWGDGAGAVRASFCIDIDIVSAQQPDGAVGCGWRRQHRRCAPAAGGNPSPRAVQPNVGSAHRRDRRRGPCQQPPPPGLGRGGRLEARTKRVCPGSRGRAPAMAVAAWADHHRQSGRRSTPVRHPRTAE